MFWRSAIVGGYIAVALTFSFVFGGGLVVLMFFAVWGLVWLAFCFSGPGQIRRGAPS